MLHQREFNKIFDGMMELIFRNFENIRISWQNYHWLI